MARPGDDTDFYDAAYGRFADELFASIRREAFGEDAVTAGPPPTEWFEIKQMTGVDGATEQR